MYCEDKDRSGQSGSSNYDYMLFHGIKWSSETEMSLSAYSVGQDYARISYAYIDTQMKHGAKGNL